MMHDDAHSRLKAWQDCEGYDFGGLKGEVMNFKVLSLLTVNEISLSDTSTRHCFGLSLTLIARVALRDSRKGSSIV
jgi:hypothetical protein